MRKHKTALLFFSAFLYSASAEAFVLSPVKYDVSAVMQEVVTYGQTNANTVTKSVQENSIVQTTITYGKGASEASSYLKKFQDLSGDFDLNKLSSVMGDLNKAENAKTKTAEQNALEIDIITKETNAKIAAIEENQIELRKKIMEDPKSAKKYQKEINKNEDKKSKLLKALAKDIAKKKKKNTQEMLKLSKSIDDLKGKAGELADLIKFTPADYDSAKDLEETAKGLMPENEKDVSFQVMQAFQKRYKIIHYAALQMAIYRSATIKASLEKNNKKMQETFEAVDTMEGSTSSVTALIKMRTENIKGLINYTEIMLQRLQVLMAYDLAYNNFGSANVKQATGNFNFDNYKFTPPEGKGKSESESFSRGLLNEGKDALKNAVKDKVGENMSSPSATDFLDGVVNKNDEQKSVKKEPVKENVDEKI